MRTYQEIMIISEIHASKVGRNGYNNIPNNYPSWAKLCDMNDRWINSYIEKIKNWHEPQSESRFHLVDSTSYLIRTSYSLLGGIS